MHEVKTTDFLPLLYVHDSFAITGLKLCVVDDSCLFEVVPLENPGAIVAATAKAGIRSPQSSLIIPIITIAYIPIGEQQWWGAPAGKGYLFSILDDALMIENKSLLQEYLAINLRST